MRIRASLALVLIVASTLMGLLLLGNAGHDDSHITYGAAESMCRTGLPTNVNGRWVEQSSTPGFTLLIALFACTLPVSTPTIGVLLSLVGRALALWLLFVVGERAAPRFGLWAVVVAATEPVYAYWSTSGMETSWSGLAYLALPLAFLHLESGRASAFVVVSSSVVLLRPEGTLVFGCVLAATACWTLVDPLLRRRDFWSWTVVPFGMAAVLTFGRRLVYGAWVPQPVLAKAFHKGSRHEGWTYLVEHGPLVGWTIAAALCAILGVALTSENRRQRLHAVLLGSSICAQLGFAILSGGDWMQVGRFFAPVVPLAVAACALGLQRAPRLGVPLGVLLVGRHLWIAHDVAMHTGTGRPLPDAIALRTELGGGYPLWDYANVAHTRDVLLLRELEEAIALVRAQGEDPIVVYSGQGGMVPYHLSRRHGDVFFVDANSLVTNAVNPCIPSSALAEWGTGLHFYPAVLMRHSARIERDCGVAPPAIVYESGQSSSRVLKGTDYRVVARVSRVRRPPTLLGNRARASGWVAVRGDLLEPFE